MNRSELKQLSKSQLKGHWKVPILLTIIYGVLVFTISMLQNYVDSAILSFLFLILTLFIEVWAVVGFPNFYLKFIENNDIAKFKDFFTSKALWLKALWYVLFMSLIGAVFGAIIGITLVLSISYSFFGYITFTGFIWPSLLIIIALGIVLIIFNISISMTAYILVDKQGTRFFEALKLSMKMMKGNKWDYFVLYISFIGWAILCVCTLGIGFIWLSPYVTLTISNFYKELERKYNSTKDLSEY